MLRNDHRGQQPARAGGNAKGAKATLLGVLLLSLGLTGTVAGSTHAAGAASVGSAPGAGRLPNGAAIAGYTDPTGHNHSYRHGAVPRVIAASATPRAVPAVTPYVTTPASATSAASTRTGQSGQAVHASSKQLAYGGGLTAQGAGAVGSLASAGVTTGQPQVYLVFYGSQWGTESTDGGGNATFTGDPNGEAPALQTFFAGLGTNSEQWSNIVTQYCDGVAVGATKCNSGSQTIPYPTGHVLAGVWYDNGGAATGGATAGATGHQLAAEAEAAATHFGHTDQPSNRNTQYVIASPTGSNADGWSNPGTGYCAYHDDTHDSSIDGGGSVAGPILAFTNMPYVPDAGASCGAGWVNTPGTLDGATEAISHEYGETVTDQFPENNPPGGWSNAAGAEIGDLCAYIPLGSPGAGYNLTLATGTIAVQGLWSNAANAAKGGCVQSSSAARFVPSITSVTPVKAPVGASVTITGTNLSGATLVAFNGAAAAVSTDTDTSIVAVVPTGASSGAITVQTPGGTATGRKLFGLAPTITSVSPGSGPPGTTVTITGYGLGGARKASFNGRNAAFSSPPTANQIVVTVPTRATSGPVVVKTQAGSAASPSNFSVT